MKKTIAILTIVGSIAAASYAQGTFQWSAPSTALVGQTNTTSYSSFEASSGNPSPSGGPGLASGSGTFPLYYALLTSSGLNTAPTSVSQFSGTLSTAWLFTGLMMTNTIANNGRMTPLGASGTGVATTGNWLGGSTQNALMVGWSANLGTTWAAALANLQNWAANSAGIVGTAFFGISTSLAIGVTPGTADPGTVIIGPGSSQAIDGSVATGSPVVLRPLAVSTIPEPGTMALAGLGGLSLLLFRRKK